MTRNPTKKEQTRERMIDAAGQCFRGNGYAGIGVDGIARAAGVTSGAFYAHFGSKDGAFTAALTAGLDEVIDAIPKYQQEFGGEWVRAFAGYYLGKAHRDDLTGGCAMATLSPEIVRAGPNLHTVYEAKMTRIAGIVAAGLVGGSDEDRQARAWAMLGTLIGGLTVARAVENEVLAEEIAASVRAAVENIAGPAEPPEIG